MVCQKLCQNSLSGWGSLKESICFSNVMCSCVFCLPLSLYITIYLCYSNLLIEIKPTLLEHVQYVKCLTCWDVFSTSVARPQLFGFTSCLRYMKGGFKDADLNRASAGCRRNAPGGPTAFSWLGKNGGFSFTPNG